MIEASNILSSPPQNHWQKTLLCAFGVMIGHIWVVRSGFVDFDDPLIFLERHDLQVSFDVFVSNAFDWGRSDTWRPVRDLSHWMDYSIHGQSALGAHVHNLLLLGLLTTLACTYFVRLGFRERWI